MKTQCSSELLQSALAGSLPADVESSLQLHLEECAACSAALEQMAGGVALCEEAAAHLCGDEFDHVLSTREEWSDVDFTVEHLEPSSERNVLGTLGGYDVLQIIGRGGMGVVLKGYDRDLKRCVAMKVLAPHLAHNPLARKRFAREAQAAAAVVNPHVIAIHHVQPNGKLPFLVMPLIAGESLAGRLAARGTLQLEEILRIGIQAADGLAAAHEQGLVHRDVKPANVLLEKGIERAVLTDFGLARAADDIAMTRWGIIAGTPEYMSPEQARGEPLDARSDLFSLGCVMYEMTTGVSPFRSDSVMATLRRLVDDSERPMASLNPEVPTWFAGIVHRLLEKDPSKRFASAREVKDILERCLAHIQQPSTVSLPEALAKPKLQRRWPMFKMTRNRLLALVGILGIGLFALFQGLNADGTWKVPNESHIGGTHGSVMVVHDESDTDYVFFYAGDFNTSTTGSHNSRSRTWTDEGSIELSEGKTFGYRRESVDPIHVKVNGKDYDLRQGRVLELKDDGSIAQLELFPELKSAKNPAALAKLIKATNGPIPENYKRFMTAGSIKIIACSADGKLVAIANGATVEILDAESGNRITSLSLTTADEDSIIAEIQQNTPVEATALAFSSIGEILGVGTCIGHVNLFDARTGKLIRSLDDGAAKLAETETPAKWNSMKRAMGRVLGLSFSPDGKWLATCGESFNDYPLVARRAGQIVKWVTGPGRLKVWDVGAGTLKHDLAGHNYAMAVCYSPDGKMLASAGRWLHDSEAGTGAILWDAETGKKLRSISTNANGPAQSVAFSHDGTLLAIGSSDFYQDERDSADRGALALAQVESGRLEWQRPFSGVMKPVIFFPNGNRQRILAKCGDESLQLVDLVSAISEKEITPPTGLDGPAMWNDFAIAQQGHTLALGGDANAEHQKGFVDIWKLDDDAPTPQAPSVEKPE